LLLLGRIQAELIGLVHTGLFWLRAAKPAITSFAFL
jgi:hypothetical protein